MVSRLILIPALMTAFLAAPLAASPVAWGAGEEEETPSELAREGMERMLRAIELMIEMVPQYDLPEVNENGDIIIRRKNPPPQEETVEEPEIEETQT